MANFNIVSAFLGYRNREDITNLDPGTLVHGSVNVLTNLASRIQVRPGYTLFGQRYADQYAVLGSYDLLDVPSTIPERHLKTWNTNIDVLWRGFDDSASPVWNTIFNTATNPRWNFCNFWNGNTLQQYIIGVNGTDTLWAWNTGLAGFLSSSNATGVVAEVNPVPTNGGSGYDIGDILNITTGGTGATVRVTSIGSNAIATISIATPHPGVGYSVGDIITPNKSGFGTGGTIKVTTVDSEGVVTGISVNTSGTGYATGRYATIGGTGSDLQIDIDSVTGSGDITGIIEVTGGTGYSTGAGKSTSGGTGTGATIEIQVVGDNTLTKQGTTSWAQEGFDNVGSITLNGVTYSYTGGTDGLTLVGLSAVPAATVGDMIYQTPNTYPINTFSGFILPTVSVCASSASQLYLGSAESNVVCFSVLNDFTNYTFSATGRLANEGGRVNFDGTLKGLIEQDGDVYGSAGKSEWGKIVFQQTAITIDGQAVTTESVNIEKIKTWELSGAISQAGMIAVKNNFAYLSFSQKCLLLGKTQFQDAIQTSFYDNDVATDLSFPVLYDFQDFDYTDASIFYDAKEEYVLCNFPKNGTTMIYNQSGTSENQYWEAPQNLPISRYSIIDGELYGHGYFTPMTYKMFDGTNDDGGAILARAVFSYQMYGKRANMKHTQAMWAEGYIQANTTLYQTTKFEQSGCGISFTKIIDGTDSKIVCLGTADLNPMGRWGQGQKGQGSTEGPATGSQNLPPAFAVSKTHVPTDFLKQQFIFESNGIDQSWQLVAFGALVTISDKLDASITE